MTTHYNIELIIPKVSFKLTYVNGKFKKVEHKKGNLDRVLLDALGKGIPLKESEIGTFNKVWFNRINYTVELKNTQQTVLKRCTDAWFDFYKERHNDLSPKYTGADSNALKQIVNYLKSETATDDEVVASWQMLLDNWDSLTEFHRKQIDLKYINSKFNVIIKQINEKNGTSSGGANSSVTL